MSAKTETKIKTKTISVELEADVLKAFLDYAGKNPVGPVMTAVLRTGLGRIAAVQRNAKKNKAAKAALAKRTKKG